MHSLLTPTARSPPHRWDRCSRSCSCPMFPPPSSPRFHRHWPRRCPKTNPPLPPTPSPIPAPRSPPRAPASFAASAPSPNLLEDSLDSPVRRGGHQNAKIVAGIHPQRLKISKLLDKRPKGERSPKSPPNQTCSIGQHPKRPQRNFSLSRPMKWY